MADNDEIDALAGEYVLGTLDTEERTSIAARRLREPILDSAIAAWEGRFAPLGDVVPGMLPPPDILEKILARIGVSDDVSASKVTILRIQNHLKFWRAAALTMSAIAASLLVAFTVKEFAPPPKHQNLVAVLQKDAASPAFLVTVNVDSRLMTVQPIAAKSEPGKSFELWIVQNSLGAPKSLGLIDQGDSVTRPSLAAYKPNVIEDATIAVSLEPEGGSTTGLPTGPIVFSGKLRASPP